MIKGSLLTLPDELQQEFLTLANQAEQYIVEDDLTGLKNWEEAQKYTLFVVNKQNQSITHRKIHTYMQSKMSFSHQFDQPMNDWVSKPMVALHLQSGERLMLQLPWQLHPADQAQIFLWSVRVIVSGVFLALVSWLFSQHLQLPLMRLQKLTRQLASGDLSVRTSSKLNCNIKEFQNLAIDFDHMADQVEKLVLSHKKLLRNISHELRTPLTRQSLAIHLLRNHIKPQQKMHFQEIEDNVQAMDDLIHQTLEFSRLESRHYPIHLAAMPLAPIINTIIRDIAKQANVHQSIVFLPCDQDISALIDQSLFSRVLQNSLCNALKYAGSQCHIEIKAYYQPPFCIVSIQDDGPGLVANDINRIFEPFYQADNSRSKRVEGYGLGMAIMKESVEQMKGHITAESTSDSGLLIKCHLLMS